VEKFPAFYGTWRFITVFTRTHHGFLSWVRGVQCTPSHPVSPRCILILSSYLRLDLSSGLFPSVLQTKILYALFMSPTPVMCLINIAMLSGVLTCSSNNFAIVIDNAVSHVTATDWHSMSSTIPSVQLESISFFKIRFIPSILCVCVCVQYMWLSVIKNGVIVISHDTFWLATPPVSSLTVTTTIKTLANLGM